MATSQHYLWAGGHLLLLTAALRYFIASFTLKTISAWWYRASFLGALVSYAIVCHKSLGTPQLNIASLTKAFLDENVQYFLLAFFWWTSKPVTIALLPYFIFSLFHTLTFTRTTVMPHFLPPGPPATAGGPPQQHPLSKQLQVWIKANYDTAMRIVAFTELAIFARVLLGALLLRNSLLAPIVYAHFLRLRYFQSGFTRAAVASVDVRITALVNRADVPPVVRQVWGKVKELTARWAGSSLEPAAGGARRD
ncbi:hypothetical protein F5I97DRAFT_1896518 [Phlebopus sp. FC_14]|nr:hypothetical protein F5I97DRAFT_1896518 [Phlebopus sp. FC_14]